MNSETLKNKLKVLRAQYDYTQDDLANYLNIASSTYHNKEVGKSDFTLSECKKISKLFNKSLDEIFHSLLKKEFEKYDMKVLLYTSDALIDEKYSIENTDPFCLKEIQY